MPTPTPQVNILHLLHALRDADDLRSSEKLVMSMLAARLPCVCPSAQRIAKDCRLSINTVRSALRGLESKGWILVSRQPGKPSSYALTLPKTESPPYPKQSHPKTESAQMVHHHPTQMVHHEEYKEEDKTRQTTKADTEISHVTTPSEEPVRPAGQVNKGEVKTGTSDTTTPSTPRSAAQKLAAWSDVWVKVLGPKAGPLPSVAQLKAWRADCTEAMFSATLADVASSVAQGKVSEPRALFRANLRSADPKAPAWTKEQVCAIVDPSAPTPRPASRNPAYQPVVVRERQRPMNAEEKKAAMALIAKARRELMGEGATA